MAEALYVAHGTVVFTREGLILQSLSIPTPPGYIAALPKYLVCSGDTPWKTRGGVGFCRLMKRYSVEDLERALPLAADLAKKDPLYGVSMPYINLDSSRVISTIDPREALAKVISSGPHWAIDVLVEVKSEIKDSVEVGITGSLAAGIYHDKSDIDMVFLVDLGYAENVLELFSRIGRPEITKIKYKGWLKAEVEVGWRRRLVKGRRVTLVMAPPKAGFHCRPLKEYWAIESPSSIKSVIVKVKPGQPEALLYPPCVKGDNNLHIVSYEYNLALELYKGGLFKVKGLASGEALYLAVRGVETVLDRIK